MTVDPLAEIRATFFSECEELLEALEDGLTGMGEDPTDRETVNAVFRAVHSIKGGGGAFGFGALVRFAHRFETALDELRSGRIEAVPATVALFFRSADHLADLIANARGGPEPDGAVEAALLEELEKLAANQPREDSAPITFEPMAFSLEDLDFDPSPPKRRFSVFFAPFPDLFASGNDPFFILSALADLGDVTVRCDSSDLPCLDALDPQHCLLSWTIELETDQDEEVVQDAAAFVDGLCQFTVSEITTAAGGVPDLDPLPNFESVRGSTGATEVAAPASVESANPRLTPGPGAIAEPATPPAATSPVVPPAIRAAKVGDAMNREALSDGGRETRPTVRVDLDRIDRLVNLVGELVINQSMLSQKISAAGLAKNSAVSVGLEEFLNLSRNIQESVMMIRAQPIKPLFSRMARIVRETTSETGKQVRLQTEGENTEIDKTLVERLAEPLTHMIRNAIDHGLESPERRAESGKNTEGIVTLSATHRSGRVVIEVSDDGAGIDRPRVVATAVKKGLITADQTLTDTDIDNLLFLPGFSTAASVSNLSGRGVGMDVVRTAIQDIGGRITIVSERGKGTTFSISLPLTLAVLDGMVVQVAEERIVVPLSAILETLSLDESGVSDFANGRRVIKVRDVFVPLLDLGVELGYRARPARYDNAVILLMAQDNGNQVAIIVDRIEEQRQVVIKGIEKNYGRVPGIAAATILGDGSIALILDPADFVTMASGASRLSPGPLALAG